MNYFLDKLLIFFCDSRRADRPKYCVSIFLSFCFFPSFLAFDASSSPAEAKEGEAVGAALPDPIASLRLEAREASAHFDYSNAEIALRRALVARVDATDSQVAELDLLLELGMVVASQGRYDEASALLRRAGPLADGSTRESDRARLAGCRAIVAAGSGDYSAALDYAHEASQRWHGIADVQTSPSGGIGDRSIFPDIEAAMALNLEALMRLRTEDATSALALAGQALIAFDDAKGPSTLRADILLTLGQASSALGRLSASESYFNAAIKIREATGGAGLIRSYIALGKAYRVEGMNTAAIVAYRNAIALANALPNRAGLLSADDMEPFLDAIIDYAKTVPDESSRTALFSEGFSAFELVRTRDGDEVNALAAARATAPTPLAADLIRQLQAAGVVFDEELHLLSVEQSKLGNDRNAQLEKEALQSLLSAIDAKNKIGNKLALESPGLVAPISNPDLDTVRERLAPDEAAISFLVARGKAYVEVIRRDSISIVPILLTRKELSDQIGKLRQGLTIEGRSVGEFDLELAWQLHDRIFSGILPNLENAKRLIIVPSGPMANLPFGVLVTSSPTSRDYANAHWLAREHDLTLVPTFATLVRLRSTRLTANQPRSIFAVANPRFTASPTKPDAAIALPTNTNLNGCEANSDQISKLVPLAETEDEVRSIVRSLGMEDSQVIAGAKASETALRMTDLSQFRILYFATHAVLPGELRCLSRSALALAPSGQAGDNDSDGLFDTADIRYLTLRADLVVLSACNTAASGDGPNGEALASVADAFIASGARSVFASFWKVPSRSTAQLLSRAFAVMGQNRNTPADEALRAAQVEMMRDERSAHPFFWAAFVAIGDGSAAPLADRSAP